MAIRDRAKAPSYAHVARCRTLVILVSLDQANLAELHQTVVQEGLIRRLLFQIFELPDRGGCHSHVVKLAELLDLALSCWDLFLFNFLLILLPMLCSSSSSPLPWTVNTLNFDTLPICFNLHCSQFMVRIMPNQDNFSNLHRTKCSWSPELCIGCLRFCCYFPAGSTMNVLIASKCFVIFFYDE